MKNKRVRVWLLGSIIAVMMLAMTGCGGNKSAKDFYQDGLKCLDGGSYEEAEQYLQKAVEMNKEKAVYYIGYGMSLIKNEKYEEALIQFDKAIIDSDNKIARENTKSASRGKGIAYYESANYDLAIKQFTKALNIKELSDLNIDILKYKGAAEDKAGKYKEAVETYNRLLKLKKSDGEVYASRARVSYLSGDFEGAKKDYDKAIKFEKDNYDFYLGKYFMLVKEGKAEDAAQTLKDALVIKANSTEDEYNVARIHYYQGDNEKAFSEFTKVVKEYSMANYYMGEIYYSKSDYANAITSYETYIKGEASIKEASVYNHLTLCYISQKNYEKALEYVQAGITLNDSALMQNLKYNEVACYEGLAQFDVALKKCQEYLALYPENEEMKRESEFLETRN